MQILASALPGFRDLRAPLTAGYLWLLLLWIWLKPDLAIRPKNEIASAIYDLGKSAGPIWVGLAVGVTAYLSGTVSQVLSPTLGGIIKVAWNVSESLISRARKKFTWIPLMPVTQPGNPLHRYWDDAVAGVRFSNRNDEDNRSNAELHDYAEQYIEFLAEEAEPKIARDVSLPATLLLAQESLLFTEADRLNAERQFRLSIVPPLVAIMSYVSLNVSAWWFFLLIPIFVLLWQSHVRRLEYRYLMYGALERGLVESDSVELFKEMAEPEPRAGA